MKSKHKFSNKELLEEVVKKSLSKAQVLKELDIVAAGGNYKTLNHYIKLYNINISHFTGAAWNQGERFRPFCKKADLTDILIENSTYRSTNGLRKKLINEGIMISSLFNAGIPNPSFITSIHSSKKCLFKFA